MASSAFVRPGMLGNLDMDLSTDPRANKKLVGTLGIFGADKNSSDSPYTTGPSMDEITAIMKASHKQAEAFYSMLAIDLPDDANETNVEREDKSITGPESTSTKLHVFRADDVKPGQALPCVIYIHGGWMTIINTMNRVHERWCKSLAIVGTVAIAVDYRNAWTPQGRNPFPAGLNDGVTAVQYISSHKEEVGISTIALEGECGGGNLCLATALKANREDWINAIAGVYAYVSYISCAYGWPKECILKELPSLIENDGYFINRTGMTIMASYYNSTEADQTNPLAWPYHIAMDELDPLRDEGMAYYRKLSAAGVSATGHVNLVIGHGRSLTLRQSLPQQYYHIIKDIVSFAKSLHLGSGSRYSILTETIGEMYYFQS